MDKQLEELRVLRREEVTRLTGLARATIYKKVADGTFPPPLRLGDRAVGWRASDIVRLAAGPRAAMGPIRGQIGMDAAQRFKRDRPCPICGGHPDLPPQVNLRRGYGRVL